MVKLVKLNRSSYSSAKVSVNIGNLYGQKKVRELANLEFNEILRYLEEHGFRKSVDKNYLQFEGFHLIERILNDHMSKIYQNIIVGASKKNRILLESYYFKYQVHNMMVIVRCMISKETEYESYLIGDARRKSKYVKAFKMPNVEDALVYMSKKLNFDSDKVLEQYKRGVFELENYLYKKYYERLKSHHFKYNGSDEKGFVSFIKNYIDLLNSRSFLKLRVENLEKLDFNEIYIVGGRLTPENFNDLKSKSLQECISYFKDFFGKVDLSLDSLSIDGIDKNIHKHKKMAESLFKRSNFGSPFYSLRYLFKVEKEIGMLRIILKGKYLKLSKEELLELIKE